MAERFLHTFDEWMTRVNKRLTQLERRKAPPGGGGGGDVPDPLNIGTINVSAKATVPDPLDPSDATTKEYVDDAVAAAIATATQVLTAGAGVTVTGNGSVATPWVVSVAGSGGGAGAGIRPVGYAVVTANGADNTTATPAQAIAASVDVVAGRRYRITWSGSHDGSVAADVANLQVRAGTTTLGQWSARANSGTGARTSQGFTVVAYYDAAVSGTVSLNGAIARAIGTGGVRVIGSTTAPSTLFVEELNSPAITPPSPWTTIPYAGTFRGLGSGDLWQVRSDGTGMNEWSQSLVATSTTINLTAGASVQLGTMPPGFEITGTRRGPYLDVQIRGTVITQGLLFVQSPGNIIYLLSAAATTLTGGSGSQYVVVPSTRWAL